ncbi:MAG: hypothetical protein IT460_08040 [Planctomycetes bacterium]|nr:hypothetical protein [Planctomycetota bacterium]
MSAPDPAARIAAYLERLRDVLPHDRASSVTSDVAALIEDRIDAAGPAVPRAEAVERALAALGAPEALAAALAGDAAGGDAAARRAFWRLVPILFGGHLLVSVVLAVAGAGTSLLPGLVGALPTSSPLATAFGVLGIFLADVGFATVLVALLGRERAPALLHRLRLEMPGTRRDAALSLVFLALLAAILDVPAVRDRLFALGAGEGRASLLGDDALALIPFANGVLALFALRHVALLVSGGERVGTLALDALASLCAAVLAVVAMTRDALIRVPDTAGLTAAQARTLTDLLVRTVFVVALVSGVLLVARFVRRVLRIRQLV